MYNVHSCVQKVRKSQDEIVVLIVTLIILELLSGKIDTKDNRRVKKNKKTITLFYREQLCKGVLPYGLKSIL